MNGVGLTRMVRAGEWWEFKLLPVAAFFYATAFLQHVAIASLWREALLLLGALVPGAIYVSLINDLTDRDVDRAVGKADRLNGRVTLSACMVAAAVAVGLVLIWRWRHVPALDLPYLAAWIAFSCYSLPPFRFKTRGFAGVLCDAVGAHVGPTLVGVALASRGAIDPLWYGVVGTWALALGVRSILWHQIDDATADRTVGARTFTVRHGVVAARRLVYGVVFPIELAALSIALVHLGSLLAIVALAGYWLGAVRHTRWSGTAIAIIADPSVRSLPALLGYYSVILPAAVLAVSVLEHATDGVVVVVHLLLFPREITGWMRNLWQTRPRWRLV